MDKLAQQMSSPDQSAIMQLIQKLQDPEAAKRERMANIVQNIGTGLAGVASSFNKGSGARLQGMYQDQLANQVANQQKTRQTRQSSIMDLLKLGKSDPTSGMKEYQLYTQQAQAQGQQPLNFEQWDLNRRSAGAGPSGMDIPGYKEFMSDIFNDKKAPASDVDIDPFAAGENMSKVQQYDYEDPESGIKIKFK